MVTSLQLPITSSFPRQSSSLPAFNRRCFSKTACAKIPFPPVNPGDPFLSKLASVADKSPEKLLNRPSNSDTPPFLDIFDSPQLMATPAQVSYFYFYLAEIVICSSVVYCLPSIFLEQAVVVSFWVINRSLKLIEEEVYRHIMRLRICTPAKEVKLFCDRKISFTFDTH